MVDTPADSTLLPPHEGAYGLSQSAVQFAERWEWSKASDAMQKAVLLAPASWAFLGSGFRRLQMTGRLEEAAEVLRGSLREAPDASPELWNALGCFELELGHTDAAVDACRRAATASPPRAPLLGNLGAALRAAGRRAEADECLHRARVLLPGDLRVQRLAMLSGATADALGLLFLSGTPHGQLLQALAYTGEACEEGHKIQLLSERQDAWRVAGAGGRDAATVLRPGAPVIASFWNPSGLILKEGRIAASSCRHGRFEAEIRGPEPRRVQRRRHLRLPITEDFVRADQRLPSGILNRRALADLSAGGLSYLDPDPPALGAATEFRLDFGRSQVVVPGVVRNVRTELAPDTKVGVEFTAGEKALDQISRFLHDYQRVHHAAQRAIGN